MHPDQTKAVKGQNSKILVTAGTIKGPLPCPVEEIEKKRIFHDIKKIRTKIERKGKKTKKERRELVRKSMHQ